MENINDLLGRRAQLVKDARALLETAKTEGRADLSAEEEASYQAYMSEVDQIKRTVDRETTLREAEKAAVIAHDNAEGRKEVNSDVEKRAYDFFTGKTHEPMELRYTAAEVRDLAKGTATSGGNTVPTGFVRQLYQALVDTSTMRQTNARVIATDNGEDLPFPVAGTHSTANLFGETVQITTSDPAFTQVTLKAYKYGVIVPVSRELLSDTAVDLLGYIAEETGRAIAIKQGAHFATGTGTGQPKGVVAAASFGVTASGTNAVTANELISLYHSLGVPYRRNAAFLTNDATVAAIRKLTNAGTIDYVWRPGLADGIPDTLLGRPVYSDPNIDTLATGKKVVLFGDYSKYLIRDVASLRFERSDEFKFDTDMVWFKAVARADGNLLDTAAVKYIITS